MPVIISRTVEICPFRSVNGQPEYLLLKRAAEEKLYPNIWQFISGTMHDGETAVEAAMREFSEEVGIAFENIWVVPFVNTFYDPRDDAVNLSPFFAAEIAQGVNPAISPEHSAFEWLSYENALARLLWPGQRSGLEIVHHFILSGEKGASLTRVRP